ncbi:MAG TPA: tRNA (adenosine(37)-N6)-threonylcarbamoyltransferase complex dimerization subunit type 1 TsaB [Anaerolineaceae bacterium]|nr:MAG: Peptidase M22 family protein [Anaerolineae bacterium 49_20]HAE85144.1 tRNA (adenosine(37)-N6)-threonylcarbamoyltransferase complex dimerization subunit type 1 TsaB [Anaerolineaceae bacterium]
MLLAIDTSTNWIGLALFDGTQILCEQTWHSQSYHTTELVPAIDEILTRTQVRRAELSGLGIALGPGSFTGLRIGMSVCKGLALALDLPVAGFPSLDILAVGQPLLRRPMITLLQVGRGRFAWARYFNQDKQWVQEGSVQVSSPREIAATIKSPVYICGEMGAEERRILGRKWKTARLCSPAQGLRRPAVLAEMAWQRLHAGKADDVVSLAPIYVHTLSNVPDL